MKISAILWTVVFILLVMAVSSVVLGAVVETREVNVDSETSIKTDKSSAPAAMVAAQVCQKGISGQAIEGGFSIVNADGFCDLIRLSDVMLAASNAQRELGNNQYADIYMGYYNQALEDANNLIQNTSYATYLDRLFSSLLIPAVVVVGLVLLL